jgi:fructuronate reductase
LLERWSNPRIRHQLAQIAADGSQKLPMRILPVIRAERADRPGGEIPLAATRILAAWVCHLRGSGAPVSDVRADEAVAAASGPLPESVRRVLALLDPGLADDDQLVHTVAEQARDLSASVR